jgi:hypothetical protein
MPHRLQKACSLVALLIAVLGVAGCTSKNAANGDDWFQPTYQPAKLKTFVPVIVVEPNAHTTLQQMP